MKRMRRQIAAVALVMLLAGAGAGCTIHHEKPTDWAAERALTKPQDVSGRFRDTHRLGYYLFDQRAQGLTIDTCSITVASDTGRIAFEAGGKSVLEWSFSHTVEDGWLRATPARADRLSSDNGITAVTRHTLWLRPNAEGGVTIRTSSRSAGLAVVVPMIATDVYWFRLTRIK
jgi:hypothetical protein